MPQRKSWFQRLFSRNVAEPEVQEPAPAMTAEQRRAEPTRKTDMQDLADQIQKSRDGSMFFASSEFKKVQSCLKDINELMQKPVDLKNTQRMFELSEALGKACDVYLDTRKGARTEKGQERLKMVEAIRDIQKGEKYSTFRYQFEEDVKAGKDISHYTWGDVAKETRTLREDVTDKKKETVGANTSERLKVTHEGTRGFFTPAATAFTPEEFQQEYFKNMEALQNGKARAEALSQYVEGINSNYYMAYPMPLKLEKAQDAGQVIDADFKFGMLMDFARQSGCRAILQDEEKFRANPQLVDDCIEYGMKRQKFDDQMGAKNLYGIDANADLSNRNIASSRLAALIGRPDLLAQSKLMTVKNGEVLKTGCFMEYARGIDARGDIAAADKAELAKVTDFTHPKLQRDLTTLQFLDMIAGQGDRHGGNMFYQLQEGNPTVLTGVQGIDNDLAFGEKSLKELCALQGSKLGQMESLQYIDRQTAENIMNIDRSVLNYAFVDLLSEKEIDAMEVRLGEIQKTLSEKEIKDGKEEYKIKRLEEDEWTPATAKDLIDRNTYYEAVRGELGRNAARVEQRQQMAEQDKQQAEPQAKEEEKPQIKEEEKPQNKQQKEADQSSGRTLVTLKELGESEATVRPRSERSSAPTPKQKQPETGRSRSHTM